MGVQIEAACSTARAGIEDLKAQVAGLHNSDVFAEDSCMLAGANVPEDQHANMHANIALAYRHLEDARMRVGKIMQASQGGISILDK